VLGFLLSLITLSALANTLGGIVRADLLGCFQINNKLELGRLLDWQIGGLGALQNLVDISGGLLERRVIPLPLLLLWHHRRVMAGNEPLRTIPAIGIAIAATDYCACLGERKCVETSINGGVAADLYEAQINLSGGAIL
jgi:hypothetical protein